MIRDKIMDQYVFLFKFAMRLTRNTAQAEDLLHDTIVRTIEKESYYQPDTNLFSWMSKIMFNLFVTQHRRSKKFDTQYDPEVYIQKLTTEASQPAALELSLMMDDIEKLTPDHKQVILGVMNGESYDEMAVKAGVPVGTIRSRVRRARYALEIRDMPQ